MDLTGPWSPALRDLNALRIAVPLLCVFAVAGIRGVIEMRHRVQPRSKRSAGCDRRSRQRTSFPEIDVAKAGNR